MKTTTERKTMKVKYYNTPEFKSAQSARMKEYWRKHKAAKQKPENKIQVSAAMRAKYVPDDEVTAKVEILRKLMDNGELASFLSTKAHAIINESNGYRSEKT
jgi:hypothetical protein